MATCTQCLHWEAVFNKQNREFNTAINYTITTDEPALFLKVWQEGDWDTIRTEWPDFELPEIATIKSPSNEL